jgi:heptosyltransferase-2
MTLASSKPRLLIIELWGLGDLVIATPFLRAALQKYDVTLVAKPHAKELGSKLWPGVNIIPFVAPWTAFRGKYRFHRWPWRKMFRVGRKIRETQFDLGLSARWDPRDHFLLAFGGIKERLGFPRVGSQVFLTRALDRPGMAAHRYENWRAVGRAIGIELPVRENIVNPMRNGGNAGEILVHTGAGQPIRVWPLESYRTLVARLRQGEHRVRVVCDPEQRDWWVRNGEPEVATPRTVAELFELLDRAIALIGNDSGPGHLAAFAGVPTFTIFGPQLSEWFVPLHPAAQWVDGKACPYKPCSDYCRFEKPVCLTGLAEAEVWPRIESFLKQAGTQTPILT